MKISKFAHIIAICFCIAIFGQFAQSEQPGAKVQPKGSVLNPPAAVSVVGASIFVNGELLKNGDYKGACPVNLKFKFTLLATEPTQVKYFLQRGDGSKPSPTKEVNIPKANEPVFIAEPWELGANTPQFKDFKSSMTFTTKYPNPAHQGIDFTVHCK